MLKSTFLQCLAIICLCAGASFGDAVKSVNTDGNSVVLTLANDAVVLTPINDYTVKVEFKSGGNDNPATEIIDPQLSSDLTFVSAATSADPVVLEGAQYTVSIAKNPFTIQLLDKTGAVLFTSSNIVQSEIAATVLQGNYYGFRNDPNSNLVQTGKKDIAPGKQGRACSPFLWTTKGFGILMDSEYGSIDINGTAFSLARGGSCANKNNLFFLMTGTPRQIMRNYYRVTGFFDMPHIWATGFMNSEWGLNEAEMMGHIKNYRDKDIPLDAFILDYDWFNHKGSNNGDFRWNEKNFPSAMSGDLKKKCDSLGVRLVGIRKPHGAWGGSYDFYKEENRTWYWEQFIKPEYNSYERGIIAYWNDECDAGYPPFAFLYMQKAQYDGQRSYNNKRVWSINRNYMGGAHRYGYGLWSGDISTGFSNMANQRRFMLSSINLGAAWWSMDIGGFYGTPNTENYYRWMQFGAFVPIYRVHGTRGQQRQPWKYGTDGEQIAGKFVRLRYSLTPYVYSAYWMLHLEGLPIARPLIIDFPDDPTIAQNVDSWMFGEAFHVTPVVTEGASSQKVYLPRGKWVNFWNDEITDGGKELTVPVTKEMIPLYVKQGAVIPRRPHGTCSEDPSAMSEIAFHVYSGADGAFEYFDDDGWTYKYEKGVYCRISYSHESSNGQELVNIKSKVNGFTPAKKTGYFTFHGIGEKPEFALAQSGDIKSKFVEPATLSSAVAPAWTYNAAAKTATVKVDNPFADGIVAVSSTAVSTRFQNPAKARIRSISVAGNHLVLALDSPLRGEKAAVYLSDAQGRRIATLHDGRIGGSEMRIPLDAIPAGCYNAIIETAGRRISRRIMVVR